VLNMVSVSAQYDVQNICSLPFSTLDAWNLRRGTDEHFTIAFV
jgi:hypothetical protein